MSASDPSTSAPASGLRAVPFGELLSQFRSIEGEIRSAIDTVLESGWFVFGKQHAAFETEFAAYLGAGNALGVGSGTEAIHLALSAAGIAAGDEVITAANTCVPTIAGIVAARARPVLADIDPFTYTIDAQAAARAITGRTRAIVPVHLYGHPCDMDPILALGRARGIAVIEDCAQAHGTTYRGRFCGTLGDAGAFSFYPSKNLGAYGDGGAVTTRDAGLAQRVRLLRNYGEERRYYHTEQGFNSRLDEIQAAILRVKLRHLDAWNDARRERAELYRGLLRDVAWLKMPIDASWARHTYHLFVVRSARRDELRAYLSERGIGTQLHYPIPVHLQPCYAGLGWKAGAFPHAEQACNEVLSLPMYPELPFDDVRRVAEAIAAFPG